MHKSYNTQLMMARRLARFRLKARLAEGLNPDDPDPSIKRKDFVKRVAAELYESMVFTGNENPVVEEIRQELCKALHKEVEFTYPPGGRLYIVAREAGVARPLTPQESRKAMDYLKTITDAAVDRNMLEKSEETGVYC